MSKKSIGRWALKIAIWAFEHRDEIVAIVDEIKSDKK